MSVWGSWLESQLAQSEADRSFGNAQAQRCTRDLAQACGALERGSGTVYGTQLDAVRHAEMSPVLPRIRSMLADWGDVFEAAYGSEGRKVWSEICRNAGIVVVSEPVVLDDEVYPELDAVRQSPGNRQALKTLADVLVERGDPIGAHLHRALELEGLHRGTPRFFELTRALHETETTERDRLIALVWPKPLLEAAGNAYFRRGLPVNLMIDRATLGRFSHALWARAPIADAHLQLDGNEKIEPSLARHPALARATSLAIGFRAFSTTDIGPLLEREGPAIERLHVAWTNAKRLVQLKKLRYPAALQRLSLTSPPEGKRRMLTAADVDGLAGLGFTALRELVLTAVGLKSDGLAALERAGWPLETLALHLSLAPQSVAALATSPLLSAVRTLVIRGTALGPDGAAALASSAQLQQLVCLDLRQSMGDDLDAFVDAFALPQLRSLVLGGRALRPEAMGTIAASDAFSEIVELDLTGADIGDEGVAALAEGTHFRALRHLALRGNKITSAGTKALAKAPWFAQLESLDIPVDAGP